MDEKTENWVLPTTTKFRYSFLTGNPRTLKNDHVNYLKKGWVGQVYHSQFNAKARGTATLIHKDIPFLAKEMMLIRMGDLSLYRANYLPVLSSRSMSTPQIMMIVISLTSYFPPYLATTITI